MRTFAVYTGAVKNITFSADEDLIERAREVAKAEHKGNLKVQNPFVGI